MLKLFCVNTREGLVSGASLSKTALVKHQQTMKWDVGIWGTLWFCLLQTLIKGLLVFKLKGMCLNLRSLLQEVMLYWLGVFYINGIYEVTTSHGCEADCEFSTHSAFGICIIKAFSLNSCTVEVLINYLCFAGLKCVEFFSCMKSAAMKNFKEGEKSLTSWMTWGGSFGRVPWAFYSEFKMQELKLQTEKIRFHSELKLKLIWNSRCQHPCY